MNNYKSKLTTLHASLYCSLAFSFHVAAQTDGLGRNRMDTTEEVFQFADLDRNNNINSEERDRLRAAFQVRSDLSILDQNQNGKLDREEIDQLEAGRKNNPKKDRDETAKEIKKQWKELAEKGRKEAVKDGKKKNDKKKKKNN
jgi:hypothetical protein